jgi:type I restriction enzyme S subunit
VSSTKKLKDLIIQNKKSLFQVKSASTVGSYPFFTSGMKILRTENVLTSGRNLYVATGGKALIQYYEGEASYSTDCYSFKANEEIIESKFLYYFLYMLTNEINEKMFKGAALKHLQKTDFLNIEIQLPPLELQNKIVMKLDAIFAEIDRATAAAEANSKNADLLVKGTITALIKKFSEDSFVRFGDICGFVRGPFGGSLKKSIFVEKGYAVYEQQHPINNQFDSFRYFITDEKFNEMKRFEVFPHDLLMSCSGVTLGKIAIVPKDAPKGIINQALLKITPKDIVRKDYLKVVMESDYFQSILWDVSGGAAQPNVPSVKVIKDFLIPLPSIKEQDDFIDVVSSVHSYNLVENYKEKKKSLISFKQSILKKSFNGELIKE